MELDLGAALWWLLFAYAVGTGVFIVSENRAPQATLAWMLAFLAAPGVGVLVYFLFGRDRKAFSREGRLLRQELDASARPILGPILTHQDAEIERLEGDSALRRRLMRLVRRNSQSALTRRNRVEILQDAVRFYPSLVGDMEKARHSIHHQYFIWAADPFTEGLKDLLAAKARAGVEVRLLYDPMGSRTALTRAYVRDLRAAGVRVAETSPLYRLHTMSYRNHRKITVVDGVIGYTGGMNVGREHLDGGKGFDAWRDTQVRMTGEAAAVLQSVFSVDWYNAMRENLFKEAYYPVIRMEPSSDDVAVQILTSGPDSQWAAIRQLYASIIAAARHRVFIQSPFFIPDASIAESLRTSAMAGVDVRLMLSARPSGNPLPDWAGRTYLGDLVEAGVRVFLYRAGYLHAKTISADGEVCSIGSANIDIRSFSLNYELNAVLYDARLAGELERDFERDQAACTGFDPVAYGREPRAVRFRDSVARLLSPLL